MALSEKERAVWDLVEPSVKELGFEVIEVELATEVGGRVLRIYIDRGDEPVGIEDCVRVTESLNPLLDTADLIRGAYQLEVSSPGIERPLRRPEDFERFIGQEVTIRTTGKMEGRRNFRGRLKETDGERVVLQLDDGDVCIDIENVAKARLVVELEWS